MTDYCELKRLAEVCVAAGEYLPGEAWEEDRSYGPDEVAFLEFAVVATPAALLDLLNDIAALRAGGQLLVQDRNDALAERNRLKDENETLRQVLASSHEFILNDARTRHMCDETGDVSPLFPKRVGILAAIDAARGKEEQS